MIERPSKMSDSNAALARRITEWRTENLPDPAPRQDGTGTVIEKAHAAMLEAQSAFTRHLDSIRRDRYSNEGMREEIASFADTHAAHSVDTAVEQVRQRRDQAQVHLDTIRQELSPDGDTAAELRAGRYWNRSKGLLDSADSSQVLGRTKNLLAKATPAERGTLLQELASYLASRGVAADWIDSAVAEIVPEFGHAREQLRTADQALQIAKFNANALRRGFEIGRPPSAIVDAGKYDPDRQRNALS